MDMPSFSTIKLTSEQAGVVCVTLSRPEKHNALSREMIAELTNALRKLDAEPEVHVVVLKGNGASFCAGVDLAQMHDMSTVSHDENVADAADLAEMFQTLYFMSKPTVAVVHGRAYGGGVGLVACCDIAIADEKTTFCFPEVRLGLIPAVISPYIVAAIGARSAQHWFLSGTTFNAAEGLRMGLMQYVVEQVDLSGKAGDVCNELLKGGPKAQAAIKSLIRSAPFGSITPTLIQSTTELLATVRSSSEAKARLASLRK